MNKMIEKSSGSGAEGPGVLALYRERDGAFFFETGKSSRKRVVARRIQGQEDWEDLDWDEWVHRWIQEARRPGDLPILRLSPEFADEVVYLLSVFGPNLASFFVQEMVRIHREIGEGELRVWKKIRIFEKKCCAKI